MEYLHQKYIDEIEFVGPSLRKEFIDGGYLYNNVYTLANKYVFYYEHVVSYLSKMSEVDWNVFLEKHISAINSKRAIKGFENCIPNNREIEAYLGKKISSYNMSDVIEYQFENKTINEQI